jgi:hypothetical protein
MFTTDHLRKYMRGETVFCDCGASAHAHRIGDPGGLRVWFRCSSCDREGEVVAPRDRARETRLLPHRTVAGNVCPFDGTRLEEEPVSELPRGTKYDCPWCGASGFVPPRPNP